MTETVQANPQLRAPFPWFGGKRRVAGIVWERFGDVRNYVEPFAGSLAVLLARPTDPKIETVNDKDCFVANFWRALAADPDAVSDWCDAPVNEADLHARHQWLHKQSEFIERMHLDPDHYDAKIAGWWVWGISCWIGDNWCRVKPQESYPHLMQDKGADSLRRDGTGLDRRRPGLTPNGVHTASMQMPALISSGVNQSGIWRKRPSLTNGSGRGVCNTESRSRLHSFMREIADRLRLVRVCCGEWHRVLGDTPTIHCGLTALFFDPPYGVENRNKVYNCDSLVIADQVRAYCLERGGDQRLRIALCGYEGEHNELEANGWSKVEWKASGGYGNQSGNDNRHRERIWFSPHCLSPETQTQKTMF